MNAEIYIITARPIEVPTIYQGEATYMYDSPMHGPVYRMNEVCSWPWEKMPPRPEWVVFMHDDVEVEDLESWWDKWAYFMLPDNCAIVGLGGATGIGYPDLYKVPYKLSNLARTNYASNQRDWQVHGNQLHSPRKVAVVDGFFLAIRWAFLQEIGGLDWLLAGTRFHCYDLALCLEAYRRGWEVWAVPEPCFHRGGWTSCSPAYVEWCEQIGTTPELEHSLPHRWLYHHYQDLLPFHV